MKIHTDQAGGMKLLLKKYREMFRIPENLNFYSESDYKNAERNFLRYILLRGEVPVRKKR